jgi:hypothetical protein
LWCSLVESLEIATASTWPTLKASSDQPTALAGLIWIKGGCLVTARAGQKKRAGELAAATPTINRHYWGIDLPALDYSLNTPRRMATETSSATD